MLDHVVNQLKTHEKTIKGFIDNLGVMDLKKEVAYLEAETQASTFWDNPSEAQKLMQQISKLNAKLLPWLALHKRIIDALELADLGEEIAEELDKETQDIAQEVEKMSVRAMLAGEYDSESAIFAIHAGTGGADAQDWAEMLERMYLRWMEQNGYKIEILDRSDGEEAGIKSVTISVKGEFAYGYLKSEVGVHRLVRISPFNASGKRQTSFAKVELWPDIEGEIDIEINEKDLRIDTYRASGAGGQHVQKNDTAVRITHFPSGVVVQCQNQRSQLQNRERAMQILKARLFEMERLKQKADISALKGENIDASWGNQIRSYVLHPYQMVKDARTNYEVGNTGAVLNGELNGFMESYLKANLSTSS